MHPDQPPIHWGGAVTWRGTVRARPLRTGASFVGLGTHRQRMVLYPISAPDRDGLAVINWIAEVTIDAAGGWQHRDVALETFTHHFEAFRCDWLYVPDMPSRASCASCAYENTMIDHDPVDTWVDGPVALMGDAAHAMYPTGSNGASQAIIDARVLGTKFLEHGVTRAALEAYDGALCSPVPEVVLRNRGAGPFGLLSILDKRCGGVFEDIDTLIPCAERSSYTAQDNTAAGFAKDQLNDAGRLIPEGAEVSL